MAVQRASARRAVTGHRDRAAQSAERHQRTPVRDDACSDRCRRQRTACSGEAAPERLVRRAQSSPDGREEASRGRSGARTEISSTRPLARRLTSSSARLTVSPLDRWRACFEDASRAHGSGRGPRPDEIRPDTPDGDLRALRTPSGDGRRSSTALPTERATALARTTAARRRSFAPSPSPPASAGTRRVKVGSSVQYSSGEPVLADWNRWFASGRTTIVDSARACVPSSAASAGAFWSAGTWVSLPPYRPSTGHRRFAPIGPGIRVEDRLVVRGS